MIYPAESPQPNRPTKTIARFQPNERPETDDLGLHPEDLPQRPDLFLTLHRGMRSITPPRRYRYEDVTEVSCAATAGTKIDFGEVADDT